MTSGHTNLREVMLNVWVASEDHTLITQAMRYAARLRPGTSAVLKDMAEFVSPAISGRTTQACQKRLQDLNIWVSTGKRKRRRKRKHAAANGRLRAMSALRRNDPGLVTATYMKVLKCPCGLIHEIA